MPLRSELLTKRWSTFDLPILPFLAPRVFQPWPYRARRNLAEAQGVRTKAEFAMQRCVNWSPEFGADARQSEMSNQHGSEENLELNGTPHEDSRRTPPQRHAFEGHQNAWPSSGSIFDSTRLAREEIHGRRAEQKISDAPGNDWENTKTSQGVAAPFQSTDNAEALPAMFMTEEIRKRYEELWGSRMKTSQGSKLPFRKVEGKGKGTRASPPKLSKVLSRSPSNRGYEEFGLSKARPGMSSNKLRARRLHKSMLERKRALKLTFIRSNIRSRLERLGIPEARPKWTRWIRTKGRGATSLSHSTGYWNRRFAIINLRRQGFMRGRPTPKIIAFKSSRIPKELKDALIAHDSSASLKQVWEEMHPRERLKMWPELMATVLESSPEKALKVLAATFTRPYPPASAVSDCLDYIFAFCICTSQSTSEGYPVENTFPNLSSTCGLSNTQPTASSDLAETSSCGGMVLDTNTRAESSGPRYAHYLLEVFLQLLHLGPPDYLHLSQSSLFLLLANLDAEKARVFYEALVEFKHPLHQNTLMQFASMFARSGETDLSFEILKKLQYLKCNFNSPKMLSLCTTLLQRTRRGPDASFSDSEMFQFMLGCGMKANIITYNVLLQNSLEAGDPETSWRIHDLMIDNGIEPDPYTYSILLNDAKWRLDPIAIRSVMGHVQQRGIRNAHIVTDVLHAILLLHQQERPMQDTSTDSKSRRQSAFTRMLQVYREHFHMAPLARIVPGFAERYSISTHLEGQEIIDPPAPTLVVMISGLLDELNSQSTKEFFDHFCALVFARDLAIAKLMGTTHVWNLFLMSFGKFSDRLPDCPKVIGAMISPTLKEAAIKAHKRILLDNEDNDHTQKSSPGTLTNLNAGGTNGGAWAMHSEHQSNDNASSDQLCTNPSPGSGPTRAVDSIANIAHAVPKPDVYTWSILLKIFIDQGQRRASEKVLQMMLQRGITPNHVTWNTLIFGYSRMQDPAMTADTVHRLEESGLKPDDVTMKGLAMVRDRRALIVAMQRKKTQNTGISWNGLDQLKWALRKDLEEEERVVQARLRDLQEKGVVRDL